MAPLFVQLENDSKKIPIQTGTFEYVGELLKDIQQGLGITDVALREISLYMYGEEIVSDRTLKDVLSLVVEPTDALIVKIDRSATGPVIPSKGMVQIRYKNKILPTHPVHFTDLDTFESLENLVTEVLNGANIQWKPLFIKFRVATAKNPAPWTRLTHENFMIVQDTGKIYVSDTNEVPKDISDYDLYLDTYRAKLIATIARDLLPIPTHVPNYYDRYGFENNEQKDLFIIFHRLMLLGAVVILDEVQVGKQILEVVISVNEMTGEPNGKFILLGTPRLGASRLIDLDSNSENKLFQLLDVPRLTVVEMIAYANKRLNKAITAEELAYLYAFSGGHFRILKSILETTTPIINDNERMRQLGNAKKQFSKDYTSDEKKFLLNCAKRNQKGSAKNEEQDIQNLLITQDVISTVADSEINARYKLKDPLLKTILNDEARREGTTVNVRALIGNVVEGLVDELLEVLGQNGITFDGFDLSGYTAVSISMKQLDVDTVLVDDTSENIIAVNTKYSNKLLTSKSIEGFERNVALLHEKYPNANIKVAHFAMVVEDEVLHIETRSLLKTRGEMYWILDELLTATRPLTEEVTIVEEEKGPWVRRNNIEEHLRAWVSGAGKVGRISGHFGNGKTALVKRMGSELSATGKKVVYVDLLRRTGCIL